MLKFLEDGPSPPVPPSWIDWQVTSEQLQVEQTPAAGPARFATLVPARPRVWRPFLQPRTRANTRVTPTNTGEDEVEEVEVNDGEEEEVEVEVDDGEEEEEEVDDGEEEMDDGEEAFPFPIGTFVAVEFSTGIFAGTITKLYEGEDLCEVTFSDGDVADYDAGEIAYATQLYAREFEEEE